MARGGYITCIITNPADVSQGVQDGYPVAANAAEWYATENLTRDTASKIFYAYTTACGSEAYGYRAPSRRLVLRLDPADFAYTLYEGALGGGGRGSWNDILREHMPEDAWISEIYLEAVLGTYPRDAHDPNHWVYNVSEFDTNIPSLPGRVFPSLDGYGYDQVIGSVIDASAINATKSKTVVLSAYAVPATDVTADPFELHLSVLHNPLAGEDDWDQSFEQWVKVHTFKLILEWQTRTTIELGSHASFAFGASGVGELHKYGNLAGVPTPICTLSGALALKGDFTFAANQPLTLTPLVDMSKNTGIDNTGWFVPVLDGEATLGAIYNMAATFEISMLNEDAPLVFDKTLAGNVEFDLYVEPVDGVLVVDGALWSDASKLFTITPAATLGVDRGLAGTVALSASATAGLSGEFQLAATTSFPLSGSPTLERIMDLATDTDLTLLNDATVLQRLIRLDATIDLNLLPQGGLSFVYYSTALEENTVDVGSAAPDAQQATDTSRTVYVGAKDGDIKVSAKQKSINLNSQQRNQ